MVSLNSCIMITQDSWTYGKYGIDMTDVLLQINLQLRQDLINPRVTILELLNDIDDANLAIVEKIKLGLYTIKQN